MTTITKDERLAILAAMGNPYANPYSRLPIWDLLDAIVERVTDDLVGPCSGCHEEAEETCPRHGRTITEVWDMQQRALLGHRAAEQRAQDAIAVLRGQATVAEDVPF